ncbi:hypothetical protein N7E01_15345 [Neopusillimonas aromaticivorans]|nr:hypothetical protein [Neopusillimonas aromaticivorans]WJJ93348.1 hypothetical protein N7E01_15345 [Neopusillimonas aromaticivorans]
MARYKDIRPWCALVLGENMPLALMGQTQGLSLLFPMEKLFENYVARWLHKQLSDDYSLRTQARHHSLAHHAGESMFQLRPDILLHSEEKQTTWVLDTKWKRLDAANRSRSYGISERDMYQMLAYGSTYLKGSGRLLLVYPSWAGFNKALPYFQLPGSLRLDAVPFDLDTDGLVTDELLEFLQKPAK